MTQHLVITLDGATVLDGQYTAGGSVVTPPPGGNPGHATIVPAPPVGGSPTVFTAQPNTVYAFSLPIPNGSVSISLAPGSPNFQISVALSATAGDFAAATAMPLTVTQGFGIPPNKIVHPYYAVQGDESAGLVWTSVDGGRGVPVVGAGWYFSFQSQATVPVNFYMQIPQQ